MSVYLCVRLCVNVLCVFVFIYLYVCAYVYLSMCSCACYMLQASSARCSFPPWAQGRWENLHVEGNVATYTDLKAYKTLKVFCLEQQMAGLVPVYTQSQW